MILIESIALVFITFLLYLAYVTLRVAHDNGKLKRAPIPVRIVCYAILTAAVVCDAVFNVTLGSLLFLEPPRQWLFTERCALHRHEDGWRGRLARWVCEGWLNPFEAGHC